MGVFEETYEKYLVELKEVNLAGRATRLGGQMADTAMTIPFFGMPHRVCPNGVLTPSGNPANTAVSLVLLKYVLMCPEEAGDGRQWVSFREFTGSGPLVHSFVNSTNTLLTKTFSGKIEGFSAWADALGARPAGGDLAYDIAVRIDALPKVPLFILFNDADEDFPAQCTVLFEKRAERYLDLECLSILGTWLKGNLVRSGAGTVQP